MELLPLERGWGVCVLCLLSPILETKDSAIARATESLFRISFVAPEFIFKHSSIVHTWPTF